MLMTCWYIGNINSRTGETYCNVYWQRERGKKPSKPNKPHRIPALSSQIWRAIMCSPAAPVGGYRNPSLGAEALGGFPHRSRPENFGLSWQLKERHHIQSDWGTGYSRAAALSAASIGPRRDRITTVVRLAEPADERERQREGERSRKELGAYVITDGGNCGRSAIDAESLLRGVRIDLGSGRDGGASESGSCVFSPRADTSNACTPSFPTSPPCFVPAPSLWEAISDADMLMVSFEPIGCRMRVNARGNQPLGNCIATPQTTAFA